MILMMTILNVVMTAKFLNLAFALVCLWGAFGLCPRKFAILSALLYVALAFCP
ncbi:hypothetical protein RB2150_03973 [Rhodobacterales bacterium HTCC2150]|nr:hypothetical protein RB2150_03973 [Rhodobacterales bacterium HTCC2150] [Rhodobacteraceae bacterium HTCC2150]